MCLYIICNGKILVSIHFVFAKIATNNFLVHFHGLSVPVGKITEHKHNISIANFNLMIYKNSSNIRHKSNPIQFHIKSHSRTNTNLYIYILFDWIICGNLKR